MTLTTKAVARRGSHRALLTALVAALLCALPALAPAEAYGAKDAKIETFTLGTPGVPFGFVEPLDPLFTLGDSSDEQLAFITPLASVPVQDVLAKTQWLNLGAPGVDKEFLSFYWNADSDRGSSFQVSYSIGGSAWLAAEGDGGYDLPEGRHGKTIAIRVKMTSSEADATARFDDITIEWTKWTGSPTKPDGDGSGVSHKPGAGHNDGSGVYVYPSSVPAAQAPAQSNGSSSSVPGGGSNGSTSGSGSSSGTGSGVSQSVVTEPAREEADAVAAAPVSEVPAPPVESTGEGDPTQVTGVLAEQGEQVVTGVPYTPSTGAGSAAGGGTSPGGAKGGLSVPVLLIGSAAAVLAVTLFGPWLFTAASLRELTGFDPRRARARGPFGRAAR